MQSLFEKYDNYETFEGDYLDTKDGFYTCPMCKSISNTLLLVVNESAFVPSNGALLKLYDVKRNYKKKKEKKRMIK